MTVQIALRKNDRRLTSRFIGWWSGSIYSHCELVIEGISYSASIMDRGVRGKQIPFDERKWDLVGIPWADKDLTLQYFEWTKKQRYGWTGLLLNQLFNFGRTSDDSQFCSQWCANALGLPNAASLSPQGLLNLVLYITSKEEKE